MNEERFIKIETQITHQDVLLEELHQVLYQQQETITLLEKKIKFLEQQLRMNDDIRPAGEKPPHY